MTYPSRYRSLAPLCLALLVGDHDELPFPTEVRLEGFTGIEVHSLGELVGQAVLLDFFAHWCAPCARQVPHVNELAERYAERGLLVLGVTGDAESDALPWIEQHGVAYPYAFDPELDLQIALGFQPLPFAVLLDATGLPAWRGNPGELDDATIEAALQSAPSFPGGTWPDGTAAVRSAVAAGRFGAALELARQLRPESVAKELTGFVEAVIVARVELVERSFERGDFLTVLEQAEKLCASLEDGAAPPSVLELLERVRTDEDAAAILEVQELLRETWMRVSEVGTRREADELAEEIRLLARDFEETYATRQAAAYLKGLDNVKQVLR